MVGALISSSVDRPLFPRRLGIEKPQIAAGLGGCLSVHRQMALACPAIASQILPLSGPGTIIRMPWN
ncbi:hypothetical protein PpBr36_02119 [Pyricularia pennisetigena]|uniref:hypothetical protein n=1 Tax=Pyricularia pennisetigena TaxID=1578925 RepID=UPI001150B558|nr:hypothetical protein PpBr36_02119 [Pyricularia pennisetigena]TLS29498.1 hypothetical protein PpBr36_02119 [Pyricularia pennisetigena]